MAASNSHTDALRLPIEERAKLALELLRTLDGGPEPGVSEAWNEEVERRGAEVDTSAADTMTFDEYRAHIRERRAVRARR